MLQLIILLWLNKFCFSAFDDRCFPLRQHFLKLDTTTAEYIPHYPERGYTGYCSDIVETPSPLDTSSSSCCNEHTDKVFRREAKNTLSYLTQARFTYLYETMKRRSNNFQITVEKYILENARNFMKNCSRNVTVSNAKCNNSLSRPYPQNYQILIQQLYIGVMDHFTHVHVIKESSLRRLIKSFLKETGGGVREKKKLSCIKRVTADLHHVLRTTWIIKESLKFSKSLFNTVRYSGTSQQCIQALIRMHHCPLCSAIPRFVMPCSKYCVNVHKGCLAPLLHLSSKVTEWAVMLEKLVDRLLKSGALPRAINSLNRLVHVTLDNEVNKDDICLELDVQTKGEVYADSGSLHYHLSALITELKLFREPFDLMPYQLCDRSIYSSPGSENSCWNGTDVGTYNCHIAKGSFHYPNPTQDVSSNPMLDLQEARLKEITAWIYDDLGVAVPPSEEIKIEEHEMCWQKPENNNENNTEKISNKRDNEDESEVAASLSHDTAPSTPLLLLLLLLHLLENSSPSP